MAKPLSEDARNSLTAAVSATLFVGLFWIGLRLMRHLEVPSWVPNALLGLNLLMWLVAGVRWWRGRRRRSTPPQAK